MKRFILIVALMCAMCAQTLAGEIPSGGFAPPPPIGPVQTATTTSPGDIPSVGSAGQISDAAVSALLSVFGLLV